MVEQSDIDRHYERRSQLELLVAEDVYRKTLIELAVFKLVSLINPIEKPKQQHQEGEPQLPIQVPDESPRTLRALRKQKEREAEERQRLEKEKPIEIPLPPPPAAEIPELVDEYELKLNKLKQEHSVKAKIQEARISQLAEENESLKAQIKELKSLQAKAKPPTTTTKTLLLKENTKPPRRGLFDLSFGFSPLRSPSFTKRQQQTYDTPFLSPSRNEAKRNSSQQSSPSEKAPQPMTHLEEVISKKPSTPTKTPTKVIQSFDKSDSPISSPDFSPRIETVGDMSLMGSSTPATTKESHHIAETSGISEYESAKSSLSIKVEERKEKKIKLWKSDAFKTSLFNKKIHGLEDESFNMVNYYLDKNFEINPDGGASPLVKRVLPEKLELVEKKDPTTREKETGNVEEQAGKKRRKVFTID